MKISIELHGVFRIGRFKAEVKTLPVDSRVQVVIEHLDLSPDLLGIVLINGKHAGVDDVLQNGDTLSLLPILDGG